MVVSGHAAAAMLLAIGSFAAAQTIAQINGNRYLSPYAGQSVTNVTGLVTAVASTGFFMRSTSPDSDPATSESIFVFGSSTAKSVLKGDVVSLDGKVYEYRSSTAYLYQTEIESATNIQILSTNNTVTPVVLGQTTTGLIGKKRLQPPTKQYTYLDNGNVFGVPNNSSQISNVNPVLAPNIYGLDFWESLSGEYVTVQSPTVLDIPNSYGDTWVVGNWTTTGRNDRGGLTISAKDGNPETILIQDPLDGSDNPLDTKLGQTLADISGVVTYAFGSYTIRPDTALSVIASPSPADPPATTLKQNGGCKGVTMANYNVDNLGPMNTTQMMKIADHVVNLMKSPTLIFLQEIQDNSGPEDNGVTDGNVTLSQLASAISAAGGPKYSFVEINPDNDISGGQPGGNIRNAYLYRPSLIKLVSGAPKGGPNEAVSVKDVNGQPMLTLNPGFIDPNNTAWTNSRRPLVAQWSGLAGKNTFITVNNHDTSKGGSSSLFGDPRPPINAGIQQRDNQTMVTAVSIGYLMQRSSSETLLQVFLACGANIPYQAFIQQIFQINNKTSKVISAADWNEFPFVQPQIDYVSASGLSDIDTVAKTAPDAIYDYLFVQNSQSLVQFYISPYIASKGPKIERVHANTWVTFDQRASDHDPVVVLVNVCD